MSLMGTVNRFFFQIFFFAKISRLLTLIFPIREHCSPRSAVVSRRKSIGTVRGLLGVLNIPNFLISTPEFLDIEKNININFGVPGNV